MQKYKDKAFTLTLRILKNHEDAEDSLQEAFIRTFRAIVDNQFEERSKFSTYLYRIVYNSALDFYKKHKSRTYNLLSLDEGFNKADSDDSNDFLDYERMMDENKMGTRFKTDKMALENELQNFVNTFLMMIPDKYSVILTLFYINDLSHDEISEILNLPLGTVKNRIFRAKDKLKEIILKKYSEETILDFI